MVFTQSFHTKTIFNQKGHSGMTHKISISTIGQMPVGIYITPSNFKLFFVHLASVFKRTNLHFYIMHA